jgi:hypothetical protein
MRALVIALTISLTGFAHADQQKQTVNVQCNKKNVLQIDTAGKTVVTPIGGKTVIHTPDMYMHIWQQPDGAALSDTVARVNEIIQNDVKKFKVNKTEKIKLKKGTATLLTGSGVEADDGDDGSAEVAVFKIGKLVFVACIHGEMMPPEEHKAFIKALKSAHAPAS